MLVIWPNYTSTKYNGVRQGGVAVSCCPTVALHWYHIQDTLCRGNMLHSFVRCMYVTSRCVFYSQFLWILAPQKSRHLPFQQVRVQYGFDIRINLVS